MSMGGTDYYRWHDLRKNPQDLPEEMRMLLIMCKFENGCEYYAISALNDEYWKCTSNTLRECYLPVYHVDAWKYIEPFEEGE